MKAASLQVLLMVKILCLVTLSGGQPKAAVKCSRDCKKFTSKVEAKRIRTYHRTETSCKKQGIILVTLSLVELCADPGAEWVQKVIEKLEQDKAAASSLPRVASAEDPGGVQKLVGVATQPGPWQGLDRAFVPAATTASMTPPAPQDTAQLPAGSASGTQEVAAHSQVAPEAGRDSLKSPSAPSAAGMASSLPTPPLHGFASALGPARGAAGHAAATPLSAETTSGSPHSSTAGTGKTPPVHTSRAVSSSADASGGRTSASAEPEPADPAPCTGQASLGHAIEQMSTDSPNHPPSLLLSSQPHLAISAAVVSALVVCAVAVVWLYLKFGLKTSVVAREVQGLLYQKAEQPNAAYPMEVV